MTVKDLKDKLEKLEETYDDLPLSVRLNGKIFDIEQIKIQGSGIISTAEEVVIHAY